ncbi:MAG: carboxymuconolactone decarboxylase family protein [Bacteroidales bacterium]|nr:carboxymuconolactone decarboxylase family protein [Bacteroidales bacterium]MCF8343709.1 carboxymuconolactone decarboxylase family protein [Bacteroidales bacterium]MCF8351794.1 carboxymuconolactone decarboxylase family protein [Bacteroidales bacterium]MCF8377362.1 carboxymuconolactone decarboxylase family protein [Bacteroidales bacterium]MCF8401377.1 carboxymuconolactone decarboxylase family protein [Bacteroidales bacterium]
MSKKIPSHYLKVKEKHPEFIEAVEKLSEATKEAGPLDQKTAHLLQLTASVSARSEGAVHSHTRQLMQMGADPMEIRHAIILLSSTIGFPNVMAGLTWANDIIDSFQE